MSPRKNPPDYVFLSLVGALILFGVAMLFSASGPYAYEKWGDSYYILKHQILFGVLPGILLFLLFYKIDYRFWKKMAFPMFIISIGLLLLVFIPGLGTVYNGSKSWINFFEFSLQPAEIVKLTFLLYLAAWLESNRGALKDLKQGTLVFLVILAPIIFLLLLQPDVGTMLVFIAFSTTLFFVAGAPLAHLGGMAGIGLLMFFILTKISPYRAARFTTFLNPDKDPYGIGYHINQALLAIGSGGVLGRGLGLSMQKIQYLPEVIGDSIFAVIAEELGFVLTCLFIVALVYFVLRILKIGKGAPDDYGKLVAMGIAAWFGFQVILNIGSMLRLVPMTGITLPFISYGGTSLMISMAAVGVVANISKNNINIK